ncbi:spermidine synthase [Tenacibaculum aestuariivivum]|uniref:spermidine synthase n=1 Tax=Tenacibaculum aestuariivivum TaxID=2006131 RepID=UPI003AB3B37D
MIKKLRSFIWPQTTKIATDFNGTLELTWINGKKVLDSKNANYSYGNLQKILEKGISKIDLKKVDSILLLGLGGGSIITSLIKKFNYEGKIDAVEIDKKIIDIAKNEFNLLDFKNLKIIHTDAFNFVKNLNPQYNLIIVDVFIDQNVPLLFLTEEFCCNLSKKTAPKGCILYNIGINLNKKDKQYQIVQYFEKSLNFKVNLFENILDTNTLMIANKTNS